jgi:ubiquitin C-terminal hydrolase
VEFSEILILHHKHYELVSVIEHMGDSNSGHYFTYKKWKGNWYVVSD